MTMNKSDADKFLSKCYDDCYQSLLKYCRVRLEKFDSHAHDCVQESFIVLYDKLKSGEAIDNPRAFLYRTADNFIKRTVKDCSKQQSRNIPLDEVYAVTLSSVPMISDDFDYDKCAEALISKLTEDEKRIYNMKYSNKMSIGEIAVYLNISPAAAAKRLQRMRDKVKQLISETDCEEVIL